jgi:predicted adenylyl cyclase CyaB
MIETEAKIPVSDLAALREKILRLGARLEKDCLFEENTLFDFPSRSLSKNRQALRLRKIGKKVFLTFKGIPQKSRTFKVREEHETEIRNSRKLKKILRSLGLKPTFSYQKHRTVFRQGPLKICLDELDIGNYLELEGPRHDIIRFAKALGFSRKELVQQDYVQLIKKKQKTGT